MEKRMLQTFSKREDESMIKFQKLDKLIEDL